MSERKIEVSNIDLTSQYDPQFQPNMEYEKRLRSADEIERMVRDLVAFALRPETTQMRRSNLDAYKQFMMNKFGEFHYNYPTLFFTIVENPSGFPMYRLNEMLRMKRKIETNEVKQEEVEKELGQKYFDEFAGKNRFS